MTTPHQEPPHQSGSGQLPMQQPASRRDGAPVEVPTPAAGETPPEGHVPTSDTDRSTGTETLTTKATVSSGRKRAVSRSQLAFAAVGLGVGLVGGLALGQLEFETTSDAIPAAVETCGVKEALGINVGDGGQSISMQTEGTESVGAAYTDVVCVLEALGVSDSVTARMETTRALDGRLTGQWEGFSASWGYHPDSGLNIVVETNEPN